MLDRISNLLVTLCATVWLLSGCVQKASPNRDRTNEFRRIMVEVRKPRIETEDRQQEPGWLNPTNQESLKSFISRHAGTEEAYQAEIWVITAKEYLPHENPALARQNAARLEWIASRAARQGTARMAKLQRVCALDAAGDWNRAEEQIREIIADADGYKAEQDDGFLAFAKAFDIAPDETEPFVRHTLVVDLCLQKNLQRALEEAVILYQKFPNYCRKHRIANIIGQLQHGRFPYTR